MTLRQPAAPECCWVGSVSTESPASPHLSAKYRRGVCDAVLRGPHRDTPGGQRFAVSEGGPGRSTLNCWLRSLDTLPNYSSYRTQAVRSRVTRRCVVDWQRVDSATATTGVRRAIKSEQRRGGMLPGKSSSNEGRSSPAWRLVSLSILMSIHPAELDGHGLTLWKQPGV